MRSRSSRRGAEAEVQARPLRIWMVSASYLPYYGGITEHVWNLSGELAARGHAVTILTGRPWRPIGSTEPDPPGVRVLRLGRTVRVPSNGAMACLTLGVGWRRRLTGAGPPPDIVHIQSPLEPGLPLWALRRLPGTKIGTFHTGGSRPHWGYRRLGPWLAPEAARLARRVAVSAEAARYLAPHLPAVDCILPNGVACSRFRSGSGSRSRSGPGPGPGSGLRSRSGPAPWSGPGPGPGPDSDGGECRVLTVGRCDPRKGLDPLLSALVLLKGSGRRARLIVVGDGPQLPALARRAAREGLPVSFAGAVARDALPSHYAGADIFAAPATDGESCGVSLLEAAAAGLPIVASDIPGYRETLGGSGSALLVEPGDSGALARALARLADDPGLRERLGRAGERLARGHDWARLGGRVEALYREALDSREDSRLSLWMRASPRSVNASSTS